MKEISCNKCVYCTKMKKKKKTNKQHNDSHIGDYPYLSFETVVRGNLKEINYIVSIMVMFN